MSRAGYVAVHGAALLTSCWSPCAPARPAPPRVGISGWVWAQSGFPAGQEEELVIVIEQMYRWTWLIYTYRFVLLLLHRLEHVVWDVTDLAFFILHLPPLLRHVQQLHTHTRLETHSTPVTLKPVPVHGVWKGLPGATEKYIHIHYRLNVFEQ